MDGWMKRTIFSTQSGVPPRDVMGWLAVCGKGNRLGLLSRKKTGRTIDGGFGRCRLCNNRRTDSVRFDFGQANGLGCINFLAWRLFMRMAHLWFARE